MSVVLRCPTCGTSQAHTGECEACFEGEVRYFCTNHDEGIWLDGPVCSRCGARFGDARKTPAAPSGVTRPAGAPDFRPPAPSRGGRPAGAERARRSPAHREREEPVEGEVLPRTPTLGELLEEITAERARAGRPHGAGDVPWTGPRTRGLGFAVSGCLIRLVGIGLLLIVAAIIFLFLLFGGFFIN